MGSYILRKIGMAIFPSSKYFSHSQIATSFFREAETGECLWDSDGLKRIIALV